MADMTIKDERAQKISMPSKAPKKEGGPKVSGGAESDGTLYMNTDNINSVDMGGSFNRGKQ